MSLISVETDKLNPNAEKEELEIAKLRTKRDELLHRTQEQKSILQEYAKKIEELQASATSTFILRNKAESFSLYINKEIAKYSGAERSYAEENDDGSLSESVQEMHREKLKLEAQIQENHKKQNNQL